MENFYIIDAAKITENMNLADEYDTLALISCFQGLLNKEEPRMFIICKEKTDSFWHDELTAEGIIPPDAKRIESLQDFLDEFSEKIAAFGLCVWDEKVPATFNAAVTICGILHYLPAREGTLLKELQRYGAETVFDLRDKFTGSGKIFDTDIESSGSRKCDVYLWMLNKFKNAVSKTLMGYYPDPFPIISGYYDTTAHMNLPNLDYMVANSCFVFDLSPWADEAPCDDPGQPLGTDYNTLTAILRELYTPDSFKSVAGFVHWHVKYTVHKNKGKHGEVASEWEYGEILSAYNAYLDADAVGLGDLSNASFYRFIKRNNYKNNKTPKIKNFSKNDKYLLYYMGDYDSAAWFNRTIPSFFGEKNSRGKYPLMWAFNPNLSDRVPHAFNYMFDRLTENDYVVPGDSCAGYLNPTLVLSPRKHSDLPPAPKAFTEHNKKYYALYDTDVTGFLLNGNVELTEETLDMYLEFSKGGVIQNHIDIPPFVYKGMPVAAMCNYYGDPSSTPESIAGAIEEKIYKEGNIEENFFAIRGVLVHPDVINKAFDILTEKHPDIKICDPYSFFAGIKKLVKRTKLEKKNI